jgi:hypothetical protein
MLFRRLATVLLVALSVSAFAEPVPIVTGDRLEAFQPQLAVAPSGTIHVVFGVNDAIYHARSTDGRTFGKPVKVGQLEKLALKMRRGPRVVATDTVVAITAISHASGGLHGWTSADDGATWKSAGELNSVPKSAREGLHAMAGNGKGLVALTWLDLRNGGMELWSRVSHDGGLSWAPETRVYSSPEGHICECCHPSVAIGPKGEIAAMWRNWLGGSRDMWSTVSTDAGKTFAAPQKLGSGTWKLAGCPMDGGGLAFDPRSTLSTVWRREGAVYSAGLGGAETLLSETASQPVITWCDDNRVIAYESNGEIKVQIGDGAPRSFGKGRSPAIASNAGGRCFLAWEGPEGRLLLESLR